jgi:hypothetical protein
MKPQRFRKKPVVIDAMNWDGTASGATPIINWIIANDGTARFVDPDSLLDGLDEWRAAHRLHIDTLEGTMRAEPGDWIIRGVKGEFYPCKPDIFKDTYEPE